MMTEQKETKRTMMRYLLGQMPEDERSNFEERYQNDNDLFFELAELENDLIDLHAMGTLPESERAQMESFLADPDRQKRLAFAKALVRYPNIGPESARPGVTETRGWWPSWHGLAVKTILASAAIAVLAGFLWLLVTDRNLRRELEDLRNQQSSAATREHSLQQQIDKLTRELAERGKNNQDTDRTPLLARNTVSFSLSSDVVRGDGPAPTLTIPRSTIFVVLDVLVPGNAARGYGLALETADGSTVWRQEHTTGKPVGGRETRLAVKLRSRLLTNGDYVLRVTTTADQKVEDVAGYSFRVIHR